MKVLLDTHTFVWWVQTPNKLSSSALAELVNTQNELLLSVASIWEIQVKAQLGKLQFPASTKHQVDLQVLRNKMRVLPISADHVYALDRLPLLHRDPFDRMLVAQSVVEGATIISKDPLIAAYGLNVIW